MTDLIFGALGETILKWILGFSTSILDLFFGVVTTLGNTLPIIIILLLLYYTADKAFISHLIYILIFSAHLNEVIKVFFHNPRPYIYNPEEFQVSTEVLGKKTIWGAKGFSFPSGHSQTQGTLWGYVFQKKRNKLLLIIGLVLLISIPLSRSYLGVHWPGDIVVGVIFGSFISWLYLEGDSRYGAEIEQWSDIRKIWIGMFLSLGLLALGFLSLILGSEIIFNNEISFNHIDVWRNTNIGTYPGLLLGIIVGQILEKRYVDFSTFKLGRIVRLFRIVIGIVTVIILYLGAEIIEGIAEDLQTDMVWITQITNYLSYITIAVFIAFVIPYLFTKIESLFR